MIETRTFDPTRHLMLVSGNEYLEVKWRLVWLRTEHPNAHIETELVSHVNNEAIFQATIEIPDGGKSTGWGSEDAQSFGDYLEKAETKAIGRALAALGFGTQFCADFDGVIGEAKAPARQQREQQYTQSDSYAGQQRSTSSTPGTGITPKQINLIDQLGAGVDPSAFDQAVMSIAQEIKPVAQLTRREASNLIDKLQAMQQQRSRR